MSECERDKIIRATSRQARVDSPSRAGTVDVPPGADRMSDPAVVVAGENTVDVVPAFVRAGADTHRLFDRGTPVEKRCALAAVLASNANTAVLIARLDAGDDDDRAVAAAGLAAPRHLEAVPALVRVFADPSALETVRVAAASALGAIGDASVCASLAAALDDAAPAVRTAAVVALRALDPGRSVPAFLHAACDAAL